MNPVHTASDRPTGPPPARRVAAWGCHGFVGSQLYRADYPGGSPTPPVGGSKMPRPASRTFAFEPEQIRVMHRAFETVCAKLQLSTGAGDRVTELVALRIIELALAGRG
jgi:hypothetical protein